jgi:hypothetical protein
VPGQASTDMETAMGALAELARRAPAYNIGTSGGRGPASKID